MPEWPLESGLLSPEEATATFPTLNNLRLCPNTTANHAASPFFLAPSLTEYIALDLGGSVPGMVGERERALSRNFH